MKVAAKFFVAAYLAAALFGCGKSYQLSALDPQTRALLDESGATRDILEVGLRRNESVIVGLAPLQYDHEYKGKSGNFRMAVIIKTADGSKVMDFFAGIPNVAPEESEDAIFVGRGNARHPVPKLWKPRENATKECALFSKTFPELLDKDFTLTFKEFSGTAYFLKNAPKGTAFVWIQTGFDGNRVTQIPLVVELNPIPGNVTRLDINSGDGRNLFFEL